MLPLSVVFVVPSIPLVDNLCPFVILIHVHVHFGFVSSINYDDGDESRVVYAASKSRKLTNQRIQSLEN